MKSFYKLFCVIVVLAVASPAVAANLSGVVTVSAVADDNIGVVGVLFQLDGVNMTTHSDHVNVAAAANGATALASSFCNGCNNDGIAYTPSAAINGDRKGISWSSGIGGWNDGTPNAFPDY